MATLSMPSAMREFTVQRPRSRQGRHDLETLLQFVREGDAIVVTRIDRLARSLADARLSAFAEALVKKPSPEDRFVMRVSKTYGIGSA